MGRENADNAGNVGLKCVKRKTYEVLLYMRKVKCNFSNMIIMTLKDIKFLD